MQRFVEGSQATRDAFKKVVIEGARGLSRTELRDLADELHALARGSGAGIEAEAPKPVRLSYEGRTVWI